MFRTFPLSIISSFSLYTQQWYMWHKSAVSTHVWHIPLMCVQWKSPDDRQRNCPKHVKFYSKNKFEKLAHLVGFIIRIFGDLVSRCVHAATEFLSNILFVFCDLFNRRFCCIILCNTCYSFFLVTRHHEADDVTGVLDASRTFFSFSRDWVIACPKTVQSEGPT
jgi:hypothetical protein